MNYKKFCGYIIAVSFIWLALFGFYLIYGWAGLIALFISSLIVCLFVYGLKLIIEN